MQKTLRDEFAMAVLSGKFAFAGRTETPETGTRESWAKQAYDMADAMPAERAKRQNQEAADYTD